MCSSRTQRAATEQGWGRMDVEEVRYRLMTLIAQRPQLTQREAASELGVSIGKVNYCLKALMERGHVKLNNFRRSPNKLHYRYLLTPVGIEAKVQTAVGFLQRKMAEYEKLRIEIQRLSVDMEAHRAADWNKAAPSRAAKGKR